MSHDSVVKRLLADRILLVGTPIDDEVAQGAIAQLLFLESENPAADVTLYLNSPGGSIPAAYAIVDAIAGLRPRVGTVCMGECSGMAALVLASGARGSRFCLERGVVRLVPSSIGIGGQADGAGRLRELAQLHRKVTADLAAFTGQQVQTIAADLARSARFDAPQAVSYGFVDGIVASRR